MRENVNIYIEMSHHVVLNIDLKVLIIRYSSQIKYISGPSNKTI